MGIVKDWSIYYRGKFKIYTIKKGQIEKESIKKNIFDYIHKFDFEFKFKDDETGPEIIETYLKWINKKFVYNRKTSLSNVYETCNKVLTNEIDAKKFKNIIEDYERTRSKPEYDTLKNRIRGVLLKIFQLEEMHTY